MHSEVIRISSDCVDIGLFGLLNNLSTKQLWSHTVLK